jgi:hypothetical protein
MSIELKNPRLVKHARILGARMQVTPCRWQYLTAAWFSASGPRHERVVSDSVEICLRCWPYVIYSAALVWLSMNTTSVEK